MEDMRDKIEDDDWIQIENGQWHKVNHREDSCYLTMCQEVINRDEVIALLKGVLYPGMWPYECPTCSPRMELVTDLE